MKGARSRRLLVAAAAGLWLGMACPVLAQHATATGIEGSRAGRAYETLGDFFAADSSSYDRVKATDAYRKAIAEGNTWAMIKLGRLLLAGPDPEAPTEAEALFREAIAAGNAAGSEALGDAYRTDPRLRDPAKALATYEAAAAAGDAGITLKLARLLATGDGLPADRPRAVALYRGLVAGDDPAGPAYELAKLYAEGGSYADLVKARSYYEIAAAGGIGDAHLALAEMDSEHYQDPMARRAMIDHFIAAATLDGIDAAVVRMALLPQPVLLSVVRDLLVDRGFGTVPLGGPNAANPDVVAGFCQRQTAYYCSDEVLPPELLVQLIGGTGADPVR